MGIRSRYKTSKSNKISEWVYVCAGLFLFLLSACGNPESEHSENNKADKNEYVQKQGIKLIIQPFNGIPKNFVNNAWHGLKACFDTIEIKEPIALPSNSWYAPNSRYKADSIIDFLSAKCPSGAVVIGMTHHDISTKKGSIMDYGIMGLGFQPGNACVVSYFRLSKNNTHEQFLKLCLHELGHTQGLPHCLNNNCFMRDAKGKNHADEEKAFCNNCKNVLVAKGWKL